MVTLAHPFTMPLTLPFVMRLFAALSLGLVSVSTCAYGCSSWRLSGAVPLRVARFIPVEVMPGPSRGWLPATPGPVSELHGQPAY
jgi:hypothetical protein